MCVINVFAKSILCVSVMHSSCYCYLLHLLYIPIYPFVGIVCVCIIIMLLCIVYCVMAHCIHVCPSIHTLLVLCCDVGSIIVLLQNV